MERGLELVCGGDGTLDGPDRYRCPNCGESHLVNVWDEASDGMIHGTNVYECDACGHAVGAGG
jgi:predicted RNA-binding Zn-ribbon protein involved in translation (DUF1610 family)